MPCLGDTRYVERLAGYLRRLELRVGDELIVADNRGGGVTDGLAGGPVRIVRATSTRSSYHARNAGARAARSDWLLFMDADCSPAPYLLEAYFAEPFPDRCGALAGEILGDPAQGAFLARYARSRHFFSQTEGMHGRRNAAAATGNLLVRRAAFESIGGFIDGIRSGGDVDLCWRLQAAGWGLEYRPAAVVEHRHSERLIPLLARIARYAAGGRWLNRRYPGWARRWPLPRALFQAGIDAVGLAARGRREAAMFRIVDGLGLIAHNVGYLRSNRATSA